MSCITWGIIDVAAATYDSHAIVAVEPSSNLKMDIKARNEYTQALEEAAE
jgi:hypothetical protein